MYWQDRHHFPPHPSPRTRLCDIASPLAVSNRPPTPSPRTADFPPLVEWCDAPYRPNADLPLTVLPSSSRNLPVVSIFRCGFSRAACFQHNHDTLPPPKMLRPFSAQRVSFLLNSPRLHFLMLLFDRSPSSRRPHFWRFPSVAFDNDFRSIIPEFFPQTIGLEPAFADRG